MPINIHKYGYTYRMKIHSVGEYRGEDFYTRVKDELVELAEIVRPDHLKSHQFLRKKNGVRCRVASFLVEIQPSNLDRLYSAFGQSTWCSYPRLKRQKLRAKDISPFMEYYVSNEISVNKQMSANDRIDNYLYHQIMATDMSGYSLNSRDGNEIQESDGQIRSRYPVIIHCKNESWEPPKGIVLGARFGLISTSTVTIEQLRSLMSDPHVQFIEGSRNVDLEECRMPMKKIRAYEPCNDSLSEKGNEALIAIVDSGIDVLHKCFSQKENEYQTRIVAVWDQNDETGHGNSPAKAGYSPGLNYGRVHTEDEINQYICSGNTPNSIGRDSRGHGTHVASIAAGRSVGRFVGGVAPNARIVVVIRPISLDGEGFQKKYIEALAFVEEIANQYELPVVVNISSGINAGAHDGTSGLEKVCSKFVNSQPGRVIVKSAGNEGDTCRHAQVVLKKNKDRDLLNWASCWCNTRENYIELWFEKSADLQVELINPSGDTSYPVSKLDPWMCGDFDSGNHFEIFYRSYDHATCVSVKIAKGYSMHIQRGNWQLRIAAVALRYPVTIDAWIESLSGSDIRFTAPCLSKHRTLTIPATASSIISVAATKRDNGSVIADFSSWGDTRDGRESPDICAPGMDIEAAQAGSYTGTISKDGTSMAAPHVTGALALALSKRQKAGGNPLTADELREFLCRSAVKTSNKKRKEHHWTPTAGHGFLNVEELLKLV